MDSNFKILDAMPAMIWQYQLLAMHITVKHFDYGCIIHSISKSETINVLKNSVLDVYGYITKLFS